MPWIWPEGLDTASCDRACCEPRPLSWVRRNVDRSLSASQGSEAPNKDIPVSQQRPLTFAKDLGEKG